MVKFKINIPDDYYNHPILPQRPRYTQRNIIKKDKQMELLVSALETINIHTSSSDGSIDSGCESDNEME